jgi:hypothetical protein
VVQHGLFLLRPFKPFKPPHWEYSGTQYLVGLAVVGLVEGADDVGVAVLTVGLEVVGEAVGFKVGDEVVKVGVEVGENVVGL